MILLVFTLHMPTLKGLSQCAASSGTVQHGELSAHRTGARLASKLARNPGQVRQHAWNQLNKHDVSLYQLALAVLTDMQ